MTTASVEWRARNLLKAIQVIERVRARLDAPDSVMDEAAEIRRMRTAARELRIAAELLEGTE